MLVPLVSTQVSSRFSDHRFSSPFGGKEPVEFPPRSPHPRHPHSASALLSAPEPREGGDAQAAARVPATTAAAVETKTTSDLCCQWTKCRLSETFFERWYIRTHIRTHYSV